MMPPIIEVWGPGRVPGHFDLPMLRISALADPNVRERRDAKDVHLYLSIDGGTEVEHGRAGDDEDMRTDLVAGLGSFDVAVPEGSSGVARVRYSEDGGDRYEITHSWRPGEPPEDTEPVVVS